MQIDHHIRMCPAIAEAGGLEPYPQPMAAFTGAPTGTVQARIFDVSVQPPVELTSGGAIALGSGLAATGLTNIPNSYVLDMGNAGVTSVVDAYTREGLEVVVMFEDSGGSQSPRYVKVTCNDADHVDALYPEGAVYAVANSGNTGTGFPNGSIYLPSENLGDACTILTNRGSKILDCSGSWNGGGSGSGGVLQADVGTHLSTAARGAGRLAVDVRVAPLPQKVLDVALLEHGDALLLAASPQIATGHVGVRLAAVVAVDEEVPLDAEVVGELQQRLGSALGKLDQGDALVVEIAAAQSGQLGKQPELGLAFHQQPATGK